MTAEDVATYAVDPADEDRHVPSDELLYNESWYFDFAREDGALGGYLRVGLNPNQNRTWYLLCLAGTGLPTVRIDDQHAPLPAGPDLTVTGDGFRFEHVVEQRLTSWRVTGGGTAEAFEDPAGILAGATGVPCTVAVDLTWTTDGEPYQYAVTPRYEIPCVVSGRVTVDGVEHRVVSAAGQRDHSWGVRDWKQFGWCWAAARLDDGTRLHVVDVRLPELSVVAGYVQDAGGLSSVTAAQVTETFDRAGLPLHAEVGLQPTGLAVSVVPLAHAPSRATDPDGSSWPFPRSLARFDAPDGRTGVGWIEWNRVDDTS